MTVSLSQNSIPENYRDQSTSDNHNFRYRQTMKQLKTDVKRPFDGFFQITSRMHFLLTTYDLKELGLTKWELPTFSLQIILCHDSIWESSVIQNLQPFNETTLWAKRVKRMTKIWIKFQHLTKLIFCLFKVYFHSPCEIKM